MQTQTETQISQVLSTPTPASSNKQFEEILLHNKKIYNCLIPGCGKTFKFKSEMKRHLTIHSNDRPFTCTFPDCGKTFKRADALSNHFRIHSRSTPFNCPVPECMSQFTTKSALRYHLLKHTGEKIFKCSHAGCDKAFITYAQLKQHEKASYYHQKVSDSTTPFNEDFHHDHSEASHDDLGFDEEGLPDFENPEVPEDIGSKLHEMISQPTYDIHEKLKAFRNWSSLTDKNPLGFSSSASSDFSSVSKSDKRVESTLIDMLEIMMKENQQLKKKLKYTSDLLQTNNNNNNNNNQNKGMDMGFDLSMGMGMGMDLDLDMLDMKKMMSTNDQPNVDLFFNNTEQDEEWGERNYGF